MGRRDQHAGGVRELRSRGLLLWWLSGGRLAGRGRIQGGTVLVSLTGRQVTGAQDPVPRSASTSP
ncbi:hypothetical protein KCH_52420 [Kitasatospora cheerisanensis KCTC 2395]|uniref:Uncharacterized protein n=1 Tax=Kitasatospora cheerisanensis KCTC 2395 TaxID=1348663 RepID=A0A066YYE2_9ACTN|nr:hypothetical protein KCH_52420 [Kitasatospora cheerisanensis KCTC 2395]